MNSNASAGRFVTVDDKVIRIGSHFRRVAVQQSCVVLVGLTERVVLCVVPTAGATPDEAELRAWLRERLAAYKVPKRVLLFAADELTYTGNQKVQVEPLKAAAQRRLVDEAAEIAGYRFESG